MTPEVGGPDPATHAPTDRPSDPLIDVVICTHDHAAGLDEVLAALGDQEGSGDAWRVTVVANACTDDTLATVERHRAGGRVPGLRTVVEPVPGLTVARQRGVRATDAPWVAFVDDDCLCDRGWVRGLATAIDSHPDAGAIGGRVLPELEHAPPGVASTMGWAYAEQDEGAEPHEVDCLVGAGMALRRDALRASGWIDRPLLDDRTGRRLTSGGDVEIALRVAATGADLRYEPAMVIRHRIPPSRTTPRHLDRLLVGLGTSEIAVSALGWATTRGRWLRTVPATLVDIGGQVLRSLRRASRGADRRALARFEVAYQLGRLRGLAAVVPSVAIGRAPYFGQAARAGTGRD